MEQPSVSPDGSTLYIDVLPYYPSSDTRLGASVVVVKTGGAICLPPDSTDTACPSSNPTTLPARPMNTAAPPCETIRFQPILVIIPPASAPTPAPAVFNRRRGPITATSTGTSIASARKAKARK